MTNVMDDKIKSIDNKFKRRSACSNENIQNKFKGYLYYLNL